MVRPRKSFAQHWLRCQQTLDRIILSANLTDRDIVLEIGPGTGNLTARLLPLVQALVIVEIDRQLCTKLRQKFTDPKLHLIEGDILDTDLANLPLAPHKVVANIPYNITGLILEKLLGSIAKPCTQWQLIVLLVQKEIADRLTAKPHDKHKAYGALSVRAQYLAHCEYICEVPPRAFYPAPQVTSAVVRLTPRSLPVTADDPDRLDQLVRMGFANRRKMLHNNLSTVIDKANLGAILSAMNLSPHARAEELSLDHWIHLANQLPSPLGTGVREKFPI
jgi:16S rRNA (adenine1518-N6/adenine1519-N6)-dimethyltransferase